MPIKRDDYQNKPLDGVVHLYTNNSAQLYAQRSSDGAFKVGLNQDFSETDWYFTKSACEEASEFFARLARIIGSTSSC
jgi:hypothetical protein